MEARVIRSTGSFASVLTNDGILLSCRLKGILRTRDLRTTNPVAVGDLVLLEQVGNEYLICEVLERENYIIRRSVNLSAQAHIIAANIDQAALIATIHSPRTSAGFIDRFLITCEAYHIPAFIVFNKTDLLEENDETLLYFREVYEAAGYPVLDVSAATDRNIEILRTKLNGCTTLFAGHSGAGKSSLINRLSPELRLKTGAISSAHHKGKHTTTFAEMFPLAANTWLIDTPGVKEFGLVDMEPAEIRNYFPEMRELAEQCRFSNCMHQQEPDCAVRKAVEDGRIASQRYDSYLGIFASGELDE